jgi:hypothetical protein
MFDSQKSGARSLHSVRVSSHTFASRGTAIRSAARTTASPLHVGPRQPFDGERRKLAVANFRWQAPDVGPGQLTAGKQNGVSWVAGRKEGGHDHAGESCSVQ